ncbi:M15 family metallopeptidase [Nocardioides sp. W7]|uniref:M15 family metallopeptidase n=1 Tax=Nocardioides sp. W7 TaxID=2931390 RepID=UPI001FD1DC20|nr:M15 family metallopeptidase [Nocardioides sp. W7]
MRLRQALGAAGMTGALLLVAACGGGDGASSTEPDASPSTVGASASASASTPGTTGSTEDPLAPYAMDPPGPRKGRLTYVDILVNGREPISDEVLDAVRGVPNVAAVERISLAQVSVDNTLLTVAAVDPATYRNFADAGSADTQEVWDRVAAGEIAVDPAVQEKLPVDADGFLKLGSDKDAPRAHVGSYAPQVEGGIDAVVNQEWVDALAMTPGNALLVSAPGFDPQVVGKEVRKAVGAQRPLGFVDAVARYGLKPGAQLVAVVVGASADAVGTYTYTVLAGGKVAPDPQWVASHIATEQVPILGSVTCNRLLFPQLRAALQEVVDRGLADRIHPDEYAGCFYPRFIAGSTKLSNHAFGLALDINVPGNGRGSAGAIDRSVVGIFKKWGFAWGGDWSYTDPMHFEMNALVDPR